MQRESNAKYIREPFLNSEVAFGEELVTHLSPNENLKIVVSHRLSYAHKKYVYLFALEDKQGTIIEDFSPLVSTGKIVWSNDSEWVAIEVGVDKVGFLIMNIAKHHFGFISFKRKPAAKVDIKDGHIRFVMPDDFIAVLNSEKLIGGGLTELPRIKYEKAKDIDLKLEELTTLDRGDFSKIFSLEKEPYYFEPQRNGFWSFEGNLPQTTESGYNGRPFEMYQLEIFAEYGDAVSKKWIDMVVEKSGGKYQLYKPVTDYLGVLKREDFVDQNDN